MIKNILIISLILIMNSCSLLKRISNKKSYVFVEHNASSDSTMNIVNSNYSEPKIMIEKSNIMVGSSNGYGSGYNHNVNEKIKIIEVKNSTIYSNVLSEGKVVYKIPSVMKVRNTYQVIVRICKSTIHVYENLNGEVRQSTVPITETMEVRLIDPSPLDAKIFDVVNDNDGIQYIDTINGSYTQWSWNVTPLKSGKTNLKIVISVIKDNGNKKEIVYQDDIKVEIDIIEQIKFWFNKYWQWLFGTILIPFGVWFYTNKKKKKAKKS